ncbi:MAG: sulfite exporter TauE/SafE family protein [Nostocoides sp.]
MSLSHALLILLAGMGAGTINTIVGSGSLITFPTLLFLGYPPIAANVSNNIGLVPGGVAGSLGYRRELAGQGDFIRRAAPLSFLGAAVGAVLLLRLPAAAFAAIVPVLVLIGLLLVVFGPKLQRAAQSAHTDGPRPGWHRWALGVGIFAAGVYGGYFGAAQGVLLMGILSVLSTEPLQRLNGYKNVLSTVVNAVAAVIFLLIAPGEIRWPVVGLIALGATIGGLLGARIGRRMPPTVLRAVIVIIGVVAIIKLVWFS